MPDLATLGTIALMASGTYLTRILGYLALRNRTLSPRMRHVLDSVPGCVLISVIAPAFVSDRPADLFGLAITMLAATRLSILPTVVIGIVATGLLRHVFGG
ncbi:AzlD family protein [Comamonas sp. Y6]|uniref:AzlD family protein n=1 Tax=Comamonas resistens TaxID=3046670 RepID=A0ABY8SXX9_9BURK|nr:AzlD family protein [Comamonas resistens]MDL5039396.1 AzlD family protein [Comamonas resistens]WHS67907.1 AzlD family protein [Comamonas resistens]